MLQHISSPPPSPPQQAMAQMIKPDQASSTTTTTTTTAAAATNTSNTFLTYINPILGLKIQYPSNWLIKEHPYNPAGNSTIVTFFSSSKSASATGNISGVSGMFVPYIDIFVFDSKNMPLNELINGTINNIAKVNLNESKPITLNNGNNPAYMLVYTVAIGGDELFKKMQVWTINDGKVYVITYNSQAASYFNYLPTVQKIIHSIQITTTTTDHRTELNGSSPSLSSSSITKNQQQQQSNATNGETSSGNIVSGIPGLP
jgi:PsbP-like protein